MSTSSRSLVSKLLEDHLVGGSLKLGAEICLSVDQILIEDATGSMTCLQFQALHVDRVQVPLAVMYVDHNVLQLDSKNMDEHRYLQTFSARYGLHYSRPGNGISHYLHLERFGCPGQLLLGADSHTTMGGALGMLAIGAGGLDVALAMAGYPFCLSCPRVVRVELEGQLNEWVESKDVVLEILRRHDVGGGTGRIFEFTGPGVTTLSTTERATICNMILECGATSAVFPSDERTRSWLDAQNRPDEFVALSADPRAFYDEEEIIDLSSLEPLVALPSSPGSVVNVEEVAGIEIGQVCIGSSVNSSFEDLAIAGAVLRDAVVHPRIEMTVSPGSRQILDSIAGAGIYQELVAAGARVLEPICGPCIGVGQAPSAGVPSLRTFNRNFPGRSGTVGDEIYLCSPSTATVSAVRGEITDPRSYGKAPAICAPRWNDAIDDRHIIPPLPPLESADIAVVRGPNIVDPPRHDRIPDVIEGHVTIVLGDGVSTGDMVPDGAIGMSLWSNIPECAPHLFQRYDPGFYERVNDWGGGIIVAGNDYGQGSSREQAAMVVAHLGIRAVVAKSFARIHRRNLVAQGVLPLRFVNPKDHALLEQGETLTIEEVRAAIAGDQEHLIARGSNRTYEVMIDVVDSSTSTSERQTLLAGGALNLLSGALRRGLLTPSTDITT